MKEFIYADNAATTKLDDDAFEAMKPFLLEEYGNASQPYSFSRRAKSALKAARETIANCIRALPEEIFFTSGGTESDNWAIKSSLFSDSGRKGIMTSSIEHHAILNSCLFAEKIGSPVQYLNVNHEGMVSPESLNSCISEKTNLVSIMMANNEIGTIQPIKELAEITHAFGAVFHTDAVQAVGHIPIDVNEMGIDMLSASAHKFNGPKGVGFLYIKTGTNFGSFVHGGKQERGLRAGTENIAGIVGMAKALEKNVAAMQTNEKKLRHLEEILMSQLRSANIDLIRNGSNNRIPGNVSISVKNADGEMLLHRLDLKGIYVSTGSACDSVNNQISHVLKAIKVPEEYARGTIRISFGKDNTEEEAVEIARALIDIVKL